MNQNASAVRQNDWILFGLRWLWLLAIGLWVALARLVPVGESAVSSGQPLQLQVVALVVLAFFNISVVLLLMVGLGNRLFSFVMLLVDAAIGLFFFWTSGGSPVALLIAAAFPVLVSSARYGALSGLALSLLLGAAAILLFLRDSSLWLQYPPQIAVLMLCVLLASLRQRHAPSAKSRQAESRIADDDRVRAIYAMATSLGTSLDYNKVLDSALQVGTLGLRDMETNQRLVGMVLLFEEGEMRVVNSRRLPFQDTTKSILGRHGIVAQALRQAEPVVGKAVSNDPELKYFVAFQDSRSVLVIPLRSGFENYGVMVFGAPMTDAFSESHIEVLTAVGTQATIALQNAVLYENLRAEKELLVEVEEEARKKLARDLHDGPTQNVAAIAMRINIIRRLIPGKPDEALGELVKVEDLARQTTKEIRHMLFTLRPLALETQGLTPALEQYAQKMMETHNLKVLIESQPGADGYLSSNAQGVLFYIVEEAVGNARKHAQANHIWVRIYRSDKYVIIEIQDDGVGFDADAVMNNYEKRGSLGMVNMQERAALANGHLKVESAKGKGTKISVLVPYQPPAELDGTQPNPAQRPIKKRLAQLSGTPPRQA